MQFVCYFGCPAAALLTQLQWNYAATPYAEHAIILPKQQSDHSASLTSRLANPMVFVVFSWIL